MKRAILIHGWGGTAESGWRPWLRTELTKLGYQVDVLQMPNTDTPTLEGWLNHLTAVIRKSGGPDDDLVLVGHSLGCATIFRYLEQLKRGERIGKAVLVAGPMQNVGFDELDSFFDKPFDFEKIKEHCDIFTVIHSDDDDIVPVAHAHALQQHLDAKLIVLKGFGHLAGGDHQGKAPWVLDAIATDF